MNRVKTDNVLTHFSLPTLIIYSVMTSLFLEFYSLWELDSTCDCQTRYCCEWSPLRIVRHICLIGLWKWGMSDSRMSRWVDQRVPTVYRTPRWNEDEPTLTADYLRLTEKKKSTLSLYKWADSAQSLQSHLQQLSIPSGFGIQYEGSNRSILVLGRHCAGQRSNHGKSFEFH